MNRAEARCSVHRGNLFEVRFQVLFEALFEVLFEVLFQALPGVAIPRLQAVRKLHPCGRVKCPPHT
jgi:hypothetical protein